MVQDTTGSATGTPVIAPDPYASRRGKLSPAQERAILAIGDLGRPFYVSEVKALLKVNVATLTALENKGYAYFRYSGLDIAQTWALTESGCQQYRRLKGITR